MRIFSEGSCDSEDWSDDDENLALHHRTNYIWKYIKNDFFLSNYFTIFKCLHKCTLILEFMWNVRPFKQAFSTVNICIFWWSVLNEHNLFYPLKYLSMWVFSQDPVHKVLYSVSMAIATNESRNVTSLMTVEMKRMKWIVGHPAHLNMGTVVGKTAWQIPLVGLMESAPFIWSDLLMITHLKMKAVRLHYIPLFIYNKNESHMEA